MNVLFIVKWVIYFTVEVTCPSKDVKDEFGRVVTPAFGCLVYHERTDSSVHYREFNNIDSAKAFYRNAVSAGIKTDIFQSIKIDL